MGLVSTVCACAKTPRYHISSFTINLYRIAPKHVRLELIPGKSEDFDKALKFALCCIGKGDFTLKAEQLDAIKCIYDGKDVFLWLPAGFGKSICYETLPFVFNSKHSDGRTGGGCSVVLVVSPLVSLIMEAIAAAATLQAVYLVISPHNNHV